MHIDKYRLLYHTDIKYGTIYIYIYIYIYISIIFLGSGLLLGPLLVKVSLLMRFHLERGVWADSRSCRGCEMLEWRRCLHRSQEVINSKSPRRHNSQGSVFDIYIYIYTLLNIGYLTYDGKYVTWEILCLYMYIYNIILNS